MLRCSHLKRESGSSYMDGAAQKSCAGAGDKVMHDSGQQKHIRCPRLYLLVKAEVHLCPNSVITQRCEWRVPDNYSQCVPELPWVPGVQCVPEFSKHTAVLRKKNKAWSAFRESQALISLF